ncbi:hypothetical protein DL764_007731 [Monosporascus ibericus]|uniref:Ubiquitin 3 binding protein But2 C-terminal domain-containing protein n=1 Tax=Monosporascus ibericus TaxID=155417 RepID=A0A4Q4T2Q9_9PEZI|nr:hypothetical protein DL764_007731 [Monosporascus ibericus]
MKLISTLGLLSGIVANPLRRQSNSGCCFQLATVGELNALVTETHLGELSVGTSSQVAGFCLHEMATTLADGLGNNCFMRPPSYQFECYTGPIGPTTFNISQPDAHGKSYLTYDNGTRLFRACPAATATDQRYYIYSDRTPKTGCFEISLSLKDRVAECNANKTAADSKDPRALQPLMAMPTLALTEVIPAPSNTSTLQSGFPTSPVATTTITIPISTSEAGASSPTCTIPPSAPSIAPSRVGYPDPGAPGGIHDSSSEVSISPQNITIFEYSIPPSFLPLNASNSGLPPLCALEFRMPVCTDLPKGYPCYGFSGLEQEIVANSGIRFVLRTDDDMATWDNTALHQVFPGENSIIGTFECAKLAGSYGGNRGISWEASSVRNFSLEFIHAGVGDSAQFQNGIGAWVVPCL